MSKEFIATFVAMVTGFIAILAFLWSISTEIGEIKSELSGVRSAVDANTNTISELRDDMRFLNGLHFPGHPHVAQVGAVEQIIDNQAE